MPPRWPKTRTGWACPRTTTCASASTGRGGEAKQVTETANATARGRHLMARAPAAGSGARGYLSVVLCDADEDFVVSVCFGCCAVIAVAILLVPSTRYRTSTDVPAAMVP